LCGFTYYFEPRNTANLGITLCKPPIAANRRPCETRNIARNAFSGVQFATNHSILTMPQELFANGTERFPAQTSNSVRGEVVMFDWNRFAFCGGSNIVLNSHDRILAISRWTSSENGAFVRQFTFRNNLVWPVAAPIQQTNGQWPPGYAATVSLTPSGDEILVCKAGFMANPANDDCVQIPVTSTFTIEQMHYGHGGPGLPPGHRCWTRSGQDFIDCLRC
jgi:hypothetical protein